MSHKQDNNNNSIMETNESDTSNNAQRLDTLPSDAISSILEFSTDFETIRRLSTASDKIKTTVSQQPWKCRNCSDAIAPALKLDNDSSSSSLPPLRRQPFICSVCHSKFCGGGAQADYDKRFCRRQVCDGCGAIECHDCMTAHLGNDDGYGTENYCEACQAEFEFGMGGC